MMEIPYPDTTTIKAVMLVSAIFYDKFNAELKHISAINKNTPIQIKDSYISAAGLLSGSNIYATELKSKFMTAKWKTISKA